MRLEWTATTEEVASRAKKYAEYTTDLLTFVVANNRMKCAQARRWVEALECMVSVTSDGQTRTDLEECMDFHITMAGYYAAEYVAAFDTLETREGTSDLGV